MTRSKIDLFIRNLLTCYVTFYFENFGDHHGRLLDFRNVKVKCVLFSIAKNGPFYGYQRVILNS